MMVLLCWVSFLYVPINHKHHKMQHLKSSLVLSAVYDCRTLDLTRVDKAGKGTSSGQFGAESGLNQRAAGGWEGLDLGGTHARQILSFFMGPKPAIFFY